MRRLEERLGRLVHAQRLVLEADDVLEELLAVDHGAQARLEAVDAQQLDEEAVGRREEVELLLRRRLVQVELRLLLGRREDLKELAEVLLAEAVVVTQDAAGSDLDLGEGVVVGVAGGLEREDLCEGST